MCVLLLLLLLPPSPPPPLFFFPRASYYFCPPFQWKRSPDQYHKVDEDYEDEDANVKNRTPLTVVPDVTAGLANCDHLVALLLLLLPKIVSPLVADLTRPQTWIRSTRRGFFLFFLFFFLSFFPFALFPFLLSPTHFFPFR